MIQYVLGFAFTPDRHSVLLVKKSKGLHIGMLNGLGGVVHPGEDTPTAMRREFQEETGFDVPEAAWKLGVVMYGQDKAWEMRVYSTHLNPLPLPASEAGTLDLVFLGNLHALDRLYAPHTRALIHTLRDQLLHGFEHTPILYLYEVRR